MRKTDGAFPDLEKLASLRIGKRTDEAARAHMDEERRIRQDAGARGIGFDSGVVWESRVAAKLAYADARARAIAETWHDLIVEHRGEFTDEAHDFVLEQVNRALAPRRPADESGERYPPGFEHRLQFGVEQLKASIRRWLAEKREEARLRSATAQPPARTEGIERRDPLTQLLDRGCFDAEILALAKSASIEAPLALIMVDLDHFKAINDTHGHQGGDEVLRQTASRLESVTRGKGSAFRYGGEEFAVLLPNHDLVEAIGVAERVRRTIESSQPSGVTVTASLGVATLPEQATDPTGLIAAADAALYDAKNSGRNRVGVTGTGQHVSHRKSSRAFVEEQIQAWIEKLRETQTRNGQELDVRVEKIGTLLGRAFGSESNKRRDFLRAPEINESPTCPHRLERRRFAGTDLQFRAEVFIRSLERTRKNMRPEDIQRDFEPWDSLDPEVNP